MKIKINKRKIKKNFIILLTMSVSTAILSQALIYGFNHSPIEKKALLNAVEQGDAQAIEYAEHTYGTTDTEELEALLK